MNRQRRRSQTILNIRPTRLVVVYGDTTTTSRNHHCQAVRDAIVEVSSFKNTYSTESAMFARTKTITGLIYLVRGPGLEAGTC